MLEHKWNWGKRVSKKVTFCWYWASLRLWVLRARIARSTSVTLGFFTNIFPIDFDFAVLIRMFYNLGMDLDWIESIIERNNSDDDRIQKMRIEGILYLVFSFFSWKKLPKEGFGRFEQLTTWPHWFYRWSYYSVDYLKK